MVVHHGSAALLWWRRIGSRLFVDPGAGPSALSGDLLRRVHDRAVSFFDPGVYVPGELVGLVCQNHCSTASHIDSRPLAASLKDDREFAQCLLKFRCRKGGSHTTSSSRSAIHMPCTSNAAGVLIITEPRSNSK